MIKFFKYQFLRVDFYPFGGITKIDKPINSSINKEIVIALAGVMTQVFLQIIFSIFFVNTTLYAMFTQYNLILICFNLLPIIPLDGSILIHSFLEKYFSYEKSYAIYEFISFISLLLFFVLNLFLKLENYFICIVLVWSFLLLRKQKPFLLKRFYLERYLYEWPYQKIENHQNNSISVLKKNTRHYFYDGVRYHSEKNILAKSFRY